jgi:DNA-binding response OmpR family regulator/signal transduction histidine kinase
MSVPGRILYIEDNPMNWRLVQRLLSQVGYEMHWAEGGLSGCEMAVALTPMLILLDINLPDLSGFEVVTKLRQNHDLDDTLIVALTAKTMRADRETALVMGCDGFIPKPIDPFLFVGQVQSYLGGHRDKLEKGREGHALRQFGEQVVEHLEAQLREAQESNRKLLEAQAELKKRSQNLSGLLALSKDIIPLRGAQEILSRVLGELREALGLDHLSAFRRHESGAYFQGQAWTPQGLVETAVLPEAHPLAQWMAGLPVGSVLAGLDLRQASAWEQGIEWGFWGPKAQGLFLPQGSRSGEGVSLWGFLAADRPEEPFTAFETELAALHGGILQVSLENAALIAHLDDTNRALGASYEGLESAYEAMREAQRALGAQNQKTVLGEQFLNMAQQLQYPVQVLKEESRALSAFMDQDNPPPPDDRVECHRSMDQIRQAITQVEALIQTMLRRSGRGDISVPSLIHLHEILGQELDLMRTDGLIPAEVSLVLNLQAPRDLIYGIATDFVEMIGHLLRHALLGSPNQVMIRTWGGGSHFRMELEDDGDPIHPSLLESAFEPFPELRPVGPAHGRKPGDGLPSCAQLLATYGGTVQLLPLAKGSLVRLGLPMG